MPFFQKCNEFRNIFRGALLSRDLLVQSQQLKQQNNVWNCSKLAIETRERRHWRSSGGVFIANFKHVYCSWCIWTCLFPGRAADNAISNILTCRLYSIPFSSQFRRFTSPAGICLVNTRNTRKRCEIFAKLTIKTPERRQWLRSGVFMVDFEHISHLVLVSQLWTCNCKDKYTISCRKDKYAIYILYGNHKVTALFHVVA